MAERFVGLDSVAETMRQPLEDYARLVHDLAGASAKSLALFGAITTGSFDTSRHTARNVLVVARVDLSMLRTLAEQGTRLGKSSIAAPLVMTPEYIAASLDTFPLELIEIHQKHLVVFGEDHFNHLFFDDGHVRLQCERELKTVLIGLRQGLLAAAGREKFLGALEVDAAEGLMRTLRGMLWLKGKRDPKPAADMLTAVEKIVGRKLAGVRMALDRLGHHGWSEFEALYADVEALGEVADAW